MTPDCEEPTSGFVEDDIANPNVVIAGATITGAATGINDGGSANFAASVSLPTGVTVSSYLWEIVEPFNGLSIDDPTAASIVLSFVDNGDPFCDQFESDFGILSAYIDANSPIAVTPDLTTTYSVFPPNANYKPKKCNCVPSVTLRLTVEYSDGQTTVTDKLLTLRGLRVYNDSLFLDESGIVNVPPPQLRTQTHIFSWVLSTEKDIVSGSWVVKWIDEFAVEHLLWTINFDSVSWKNAALGVRYYKLVTIPDPLFIDIMVFFSDLVRRAVINITIAYEIKLELSITDSGGNEFNAVAHGNLILV